MAPARICISVMEPDLRAARRRMTAAAAEGDLVEIRLDALREVRLPELLPFPERPVIATNRRRDQGGRFRGSDRERLLHLETAVRWGADYVDVEYTTPQPLRTALLEGRGTAGVILSHHIMDHTPSAAELFRLFEEMSKETADFVKIVTHARSVADTLSVFRFLLKTSGAGVRVIAHCTGPFGKVSRAAAPLFGSAVAYAVPSGAAPSASGQMSARQLRNIWEALDPDATC